MSELGKALAVATGRREQSRTQWKLNVILGVLPEERTRKQPILLGITLRQDSQSKIPYSHRKQTETGFEARDQVPLQEINPSTNDGFEYLLHEQLARYAQTTSCFTAEALGAHLADEAFAIADARFPQSSIAGVVVKVGKLTAFEDVGHAGIEIERARSDLGRPDDARLSALKAQGEHRAIIALGGNIGDRISNIEEACQVMDSRGINVVRTSSLYETEAMYVVDQEPFINGACEVSDSPVDNREHHQQLCLCKNRSHSREAKSDGCHHIGRDNTGPNGTSERTPSHREVIGEEQGYRQRPTQH